MDDHGVDANRLTGIKQSADGLTILGFESYLAQTVIMTISGGFGVEEDEHYYAAPRLTLSRSFPEHLNVTTRLAGKMASSPVAGFRPLRAFFAFTQNLPNPLTNTSLPDSKLDLISSKRDSVISTDWFLGKPSCFWT
jgi:hypothetical protein